MREFSVRLLFFFLNKIFLSAEGSGTKTQWGASLHKDAASFEGESEGQT